MLKFFLRLLMICLALILCTGFATAVLYFPLALAIIFVCAWVFVKSIGEIFWWIVFFALIYDFLISPYSGLYFLIIFSAAFIFNFINYFVFEVSGRRILLAYAGVIFLVLILMLGNNFLVHTQSTFWIMIKQIISYSIITIIYFFIFYKIIFQLEKVIAFYTHTIDVKKHT